MFQASCLRSWPKPVCVPIKLKADQMPSHTVRPLLASEEMLRFCDVVKDRNTLFKHSSALICSALKADVVGGCGDGEARGGKDRLVGCIRVRSGVTSVVRKVVFEFSDESVSIWISTSTSSWCSSSRSSQRIESKQRERRKNYRPLVPSSLLSSSFSGASGPGSGKVAHAPVKISKANCTVRKFDSNNANSISMVDLWSDFGVLFNDRFSSKGSEAYGKKLKHKRRKY